MNGSDSMAETYAEKARGVSLTPRRERETIRQTNKAMREGYDELRLRFLSNGRVKYIPIKEGQGHTE